MRIIYVSRELPPSGRSAGIGSYVWDMSRLATRVGHRVTVVCASDDTRTGSDAVVEGVRVIRLSGGDFAIRGVEPAGRTPLTRRLRQVARFRSYRRKVADCLDRIIACDGADLLEFAEFGGEAAEWIKRPRAVPMVVRLHGPTGQDRATNRPVPWRPWRWARHWRAQREYDVVRSADALSAPSAAMADFVRRHGRVGAQAIEVVPNAVESAFWSAGDLVGRPAPDGLERTIFSAGSVVPDKGMGDLVAAVRLLRAAGRDVRLTIAGRWGALGRALDQQRRRDGELASWLVLLGQKPRWQLRGYYRQAAAACFPSWWEPFGLVCGEAMASGGLVVGSSAGGMAEIIRDGVDGLLAPPRDPPRLARALARALDLPGETQTEMRQRAQHRVRDQFDTRVVVPRMLRFYADVIRTWRAPVAA